MKKVKISFVLILSLIGITFRAQNKSVGIGTLSPDPSAALHIESSNQGFMMPHLSNAQITSIASPINGLIVYSVTDSCYWFYKASHWDKICGTQHIVNNYIHTDTLIADSAYINILSADSIISNYITTHYLQTDSLVIGNQPINSYITNLIDTTAWLLNGNLAVTATNFIGPINAADFIIKTTNAERIRILSTGNVGINTNAPTNNLDINGGFRMRPGATNNYVLLSDALGNGTWQNPVGTIINTTNLNGYGWTILGNTGIDAGINFLGTSDTGHVVIRQNNRPRMYVSGIDFLSVHKPRIYIGDFTNPYGIGTIHSELDVNGTITMRSGATNLDIIQGDANGTMSWVTPASILTPGNLNNGAWTILGNTGTNPAVNFFGTTDAVSVSIKVGNNKFGRFGFNATRFVNNFILFDDWLFDDSKGIANSLVMGKSNSYIGGSAADDSSNIICGNGIHYKNISNSNYKSENFLMGSGIYFENFGGVGGNNFVYGGDINYKCQFGTNFIYANYLTTSAGLSGNNTLFTFTGNQKTINGNGLEACFFVDVSTSAATKTIGNATNSVILAGNMNPVTANLGSLQGVFFSMFTNGYKFYTNDALTTGVQLAPGGGAWAFLSDINTKENITNIVHQNILDKLIQIPVTEWNYISQRPDDINKFKALPKHIGPMAQDFNKVFGYGEYENMITASDMDGVLFAAIKALAEKSTQVDALQIELKNTKQEIQEIKKQIEELKK